MEANPAVERGLRAARRSPGAAVVWAVAAVLFLDLLAKLAGVSLGPFSTPWFALWFGGDVPLSQFAGFAWDGVVIGAVIGLASIGLSLTYSILNFANFAHGDYLTAGAFSGWAATYVIAGIGGLLALAETFVNALTGLGQSRAGDVDLVSLVLLRTPPLDAGANIWLSPLAIVVGLAVAVAVTAGVALALDRVVYRPMRDADGISLLIASIGVAFTLRYLVAFVFGNSRRIVTSTEQLPSLDVAGAVTSAVPFLAPARSSVVVDLHEVTLVVVAALLMFGLHVLLQRTKLGKAMRAMADNRALAQVTGIPTERVIRSTWLIGAGMTGAAGYLLVLSQGGLGFQTGWLLLLLIFAAVIMGGIGSIYGAIAGGLVIGLASRVSLVWLQGDLSSFARPTAFALMILILLFRPSGIFGGVKTA
ncbi:branched-chain amino acid ABC transporter permease [Halobacterium sp. CBA1126]|uniref:branched-chain amino acid ABC transporter permease n=1 Tax=Halobacterium sp. CBA1126 TaxID=2668074 RepID=UPI0012F9833D|nr:branched-chain amino acid ABC transporter permease [Halobacterium sp. CBA1126]MUV61571.1 branched-chain amino acid ABC transporter permease [Halobacterium sp. CBA1126]